MAIGTTAALLGSAVIGAGASLAGASANSKAAKSAASAQAQASAQNAAVQREIYGQNKTALTPYINTGNAAMGQINALLGIATPATPGTVDWGAYVRGNKDAAANWASIIGTKNDRFGGDINAFGEFHYNKDGARRNLTPFMTGGTAASGSPQAAEKAFDAFRDSTGYRFRMDEGMNALNTGYAAKGLLNSGAAQKAALEYGQNFGSGEFGNYLAYLGNQQGLGLSGASALAGVGQGYANSMTNINNNTAAAAANIAQAKASNTNALLGNLSSSFGMGLGALSSFGGANPYGLRAENIY